MQKLLLLTTFVLFSGIISAQISGPKPSSLVIKNSKTNVDKNIQNENEQFKLIEGVKPELAASIYEEIQEAIKQDNQLIQRENKTTGITHCYQIIANTESGKLTKPGKVTKQEVIYDTKTKTFIEPPIDKAYTGVLDVDGIKFKVRHVKGANSGSKPNIK